MKFYALIIISILILVFTITSAFIYSNWKENRYNETIVKSSEKYGIPSSLIKAIILSGKEFPRGIGAMSVPPEGIEIYKRVMTESEYRFVCVNRNKSPHGKTFFTETGSCTICGSYLTQEYGFYETNIEIGTWYLKYLKKNIEEFT